MTRELHSCNESGTNRQTDRTKAAALDSVLAGLQSVAMVSIAKRLEDSNCDGDIKNEDGFANHFLLCCAVAGGMPF